MSLCLPLQHCLLSFSLGLSPVLHVCSLLCSCLSLSVNQDVNLISTSFRSYFLSLNHLNFFPYAPIAFFIHCSEILCHDCTLEGISSLWGQRRYLHPPSTQHNFLFIKCAKQMSWLELSWMKCPETQRVRERISLSSLSAPSLHFVMRELWGLPNSYDNIWLLYYQVI